MGYSSNVPERLTSGLWHIVGIKAKQGVSQAVKDELCGRLNSLGEMCGGKAAGILMWGAGTNSDLRKGWHFVEIGLFTDDCALQQFRRHPHHVEFVNFMSKVADWVVLDLAVAVTGGDG